MGINSILFSRFQPLGTAGKFNDIYSIEPDGSGLVPITDNPASDGNYYDNASGNYNSGRSKIAFLSGFGSPRFLYNISIKDIQSGTDTQVTFGRNGFTSIEWAPDDSHFLVSAIDSSGLTQIFKINIDGAGLTQITSGPAENLSPAYSPFGDKIAFEKTPDPANRNNNQIWIMNSNGTNPTEITPQPSYAANPSWSPDGQWIVFAFEDLGRTHIRKLNLITKELISLTPPSTNHSDMQPLWTASAIVFSSNRDLGGDETKANLYIMDSNGGNVNRITSLSDSLDYPVFGLTSKDRLHIRRFGATLEK